MHSWHPSWWVFVTVEIERTSKNTSSPPAERSRGTLEVMQTIMQPCHTGEQRKGLPAWPCLHPLHHTPPQAFQRFELGRKPQLSPFLRTLRVVHSTLHVFGHPTFQRGLSSPPAWPLQQPFQQMPAPESKPGRESLSCRCSNGSWLLSGDPGRPWHRLQLQQEPHPGPLLLPDTPNTAQPGSKRPIILHTNVWMRFHVETLQQHNVQKPHSPPQKCKAGDLICQSLVEKCKPHHPIKQIMYYNFL